jgi:hypothetical protein
MRATRGDRIIVRGHHVGEGQRTGEVIEVQGREGRPPYVVRWDRDGHTGLVFPGTDAVIEHPRHRTRPR